jgi:hypothetical protein
MALSNLRNEPRREITEQAIGVGVFAGFVWLDYTIARWLGAEGASEIAFAMLCGVVATVFGSMLLFGLSILVHALGETVCGALASLGVDPRPKQRYRR